MVCLHTVPGCIFILLKISGIAEYNIPALEPLIMKDFFSEDVAGMKVTVFNVSAWGCTDFFVRKIE